MKKFFSVETTENLIDAELGFFPTQNETAIDTVLYAQLQTDAISDDPTQTINPSEGQIDPGAVNLGLDDGVIVDDGFIIVDGVAFPVDDVEIEPEAPIVPLSGGGSAQPFELGDIGPNIDITGLLPPTALLFSIPEEEELQPFVDEDPVVEVIPDTGVVAEPALEDGTNPDPDGVITNGAILVDLGTDSSGSLVIDGVDVTNGGVVVGVYGTLTVTINPDGNYNYEYVLDGTVDHPDAGSVGTSEGITDDFEVVLTGANGDTSTDTLVIQIIDDGPVANADAVTQDEEGAPVTVDLFDNDIAGADHVDVSTDLEIVSGTLSGDGTLVNNGDGTVTYTPGPTDTDEVTFEYIITDGDGDTSTAAVTITLFNDSEPTLVVNPEASTVDEAALDAGGSDASSDAETTTGDFTIDTGNDTIGSLVVDGVDVTNGGTVTGTYGVLTVTETEGAYTWSYELTDSTADHASGAVAEDFTVTITDSDGDTASDTLVVNIADDIPTAVDDATTQTTEDTPVTIDVFANDVEGADGVDADSGVELVAGTLSGTGTLVDNGDGTFTYTNGSGEEGDVTFDYIITDADGDTSVATATITLQPDSTPEIEPEANTPSIHGGDASVDEAALSDGSNSASDNETTAGDFVLTTGNDTVGTLVIDGIDVTTGGTVAGDYGTLVVTETNGDYTWVYTLTDNTTDHTDGTSTGTPEGIQDVFAITVTDSDGDTADTSLTLDILDDGPIALDDANTSTEGGPAVTGNVVAENDTVGADNGTFTATLDTPAVGNFGTLTLNTDGSYSYTPNVSVPNGSVDTFDYTLTDADGDTSTATLTITFEGDNNVPTATADSSTLSDISGDDNTDGSNADAFAPVSDTGDLAFDFGLDGGSGFATSYDGGLGAATTSSAAGSTTIAADDGSWTLVINETTGAYTFTQNTAYDHDMGASSDAGVVSVTITDSDGSPISVDINLAIGDDAPTATNDADTATEGGPAVTGDVLANDDIGADHGTVGTDSVVTLDSAAIGTYGTLTLNADGTYSYTPIASVPAGSTDSFDYTVTDADGDTATATLTITFEGDNNVPTATADSSTLSDVPGDDSLAGSHADGFIPQSDTGDLSFDYGLDGAGTFGTVYDGGLGSATTASALGVTTITADDGSWTLEITEATGAYTFTQNTAYAHALADNSDSGIVSVTITDSDGSPISVDITLTINDDLPVATADAQTTIEGGGPYTGNVLDNDDIGADHGTVGTDSLITDIDSNNMVTDGTPGVALAGEFGSLTLNPDGSYSYSPLASVPTGSIDTFTYELTDADGDTTTQTLTFTFDGDANVPTATADSSTLSDVPGDDSLAGSHADGFIPQSDTGDLSFDYGLDGAGTFGTVYDGGLGTATTASALGVTTIAADDGSWTLEINEATGAYTFTQNTAYTHALADNSDSGIVSVTITDSDGSPISVDITLTINDDLPVATLDSQSVAEGSSSNTGNVLDNDDIGADHGTVGINSLVTDVDSVNQGTDGTPGVALAGEFGTLTLNADGTYSYDSTANTVGPAGAQDVFTYTLTDADGDTSTTTLTFNIDDLGLVTNGGSVTVNEAALDLNMDGFDLVAGTVTGSLPGSTAETDTTGVATAANGTAPYTFALNGSATGTYGTIALNTDGTYTYTLSAPVDGVTANDGVQTELAADSFSYTATDAFGNTVTGTINVNIIDDVPVATAEASQDVAEGATVTGTLDFVEGADGASVTHVNGEALIFGVGGYSQSIDIGDGSIMVMADGSYSFTADDPVIGAGSASTSFIVTDGDGDTATATIDFAITDANTPTAGSASAAVDDDGLTGGNPASIIGDLDADIGDSGAGLADESLFVGTLGGSVGGDGAGANGFSFAAALNGSTAAVGLETVTYSVVGGLLTATITGGARDGVDLFTAEITNAATGAYEVTLLDNVLHAGGPNDEATDAVVTLGYDITDADGSVAGGSLLTVTFDDDAPTATAEASQDVAEGATVTGTLDFVEGADGASVTHVNGEALIFGVGGYSQSIDIGDGSIMVMADGSYSFTADDPVIGAGSASTSFIVTDGDGDTATATIDFAITDANTPTAGSASAAVDDDGLTGGNPASIIGDLDADIGDSGAGLADESLFVGTLGGSVGGDGAGANGFSFAAALNGSTAAVGLETVTYSVVGGLLTATITGGARDGVDLFTAEITNAATGAYEVTLLDNVLHAGGPNDEATDAVVTLGYDITDADGSVAGGSLLTVTFDDDAPTATAEASQDVAEGATVTGTLDFVEGADGASVTHVNGEALIFGVGGYSQSIDIGDGSIMVMADGSYSFTADDPVIGAGSASTSFIVTDGDGDTATATIDFAITDANTPTAGSASAAVDDDGLTGGNPASIIGDLDADIGDSGAGLADESLFVGTLGGSVGGDGAGANGFSFAAALNGSTAAVGLETVTYSVVGGLLTATITGGARDGVDLFTAEITNAATGAYEVTLLDNVLHAGGPNDEATDAVVTLGYDITDADGSVAGGSLLTVTFDDDAPTATAEASQDVAEGATVTGTLDFVEGADGASVTHVNGEALIFGVGGYSQSIDIGDGSIMVMADGSYSFTADDPVIGAGSASTSFIVTDGDGDTATATIDFAITDANTPTAGSASAAVDDDGLTGGNPASIIGDLDADIGDSGAGLADESLFVGTLGGSVGGDGAGTNGFSFAAALNGSTAAVGLETVTYSVVGGLLTATITGGARDGVDLFTAEITNAATGAYEVTLLDNVLHAGGPNDEATDAVVTLGYDITDADGSVAGGSLLTVTFDDDAPTATAEASQDVAEGATVTGTLDFVEGADGASVTHVNGEALIFGVGGYSQSIDIGDGSIMVMADGSYSFTADDPVIGAGSASTSFIVTDGDGDTATATIDFAITDANTPTAGSASAAVDDDGLTGGNPASIIGDLDADIGDSGAGLADESLFVGTLGGSVGGDGAGTNGFSFAAALNGSTAAVGLETVTYSVVGGLLTATITGGARDGVDLFTAEITNAATGAYEVTLLDNVLHAGGPNDEATDAVVTLGYDITDADGSVAGGSLLTVTFDDDAPTATAEASQDVAEGATVTGTLDFVEGADGASVTHVNGEALIFGVGGYSQSIDIGDGSIMVMADGSYSFTADDPVIGAGSASTSFIVTDGDGDTATATIDFAITDANTPTAGSASAAVDDDGLTGGNPASIIGDLDADIGDSGAGLADESLFVGTLGGSVGGDGAGANGFSFAAALNGSTAAVGLETVTYSVVGGLLTATITGGARDGVDLFTAEITNAATGAYEVTLLDNVLHAGGPNDEATDAVVTLGYDITDADGSVAGGSLLTVTFDDDAPSAIAPVAIPGTSLTNAAGNSASAYLDTDLDVDNNYGADGPATGGGVIFNQDLETTPTGLTVDFQEVFYDISADGQTLTAYTASVANVFTVELQPVGSPDQYVVTMNETLDSTQDIDFNGGNYNFVGGNNSWTGFVPLGETLGGVPVDNNSPDLLLTPAESGMHDGTVNTTATIGGIGSGASVGSDETFRVDFVTDLRGDPADTVGGQNYGDILNRDHEFDGHYTVNGATALFKSTSGSTVRITAFDDNATTGTDGNNIVGDGVSDTITGVTIAFEGVAFGTVIIPTTTPTDYIVNGVTFTVTLDNSDGSVLIAGIEGDSGSSLDGTVIGVFTDDGYNSVEYTHVAGGTFQVGDFGATTLTSDPVNFIIPVEIVDGDGDVATDAGSVLDITVNPAVPDAQIKYSAPDTMDDMSALLVAANDFADDFGFDVGAARGSMNTGFSGMAVLLGGMAMASEANAFENIFEAVQPAFDASDFGGLTNEFAANDMNNPLEFAFESISGLDEMSAGQEAGFDASPFGNSSPFTGDDFEASDLLGSAFEAINGGFDNMAPGEFSGTEVAPQAFEAGFGMPDLDMSNQFFLDTELDDLLAKLPEVAGDGTLMAENIEAINVDAGSDITTGIETGVFQGVMPDGLAQNGIGGEQTLQGLEDFHILAMANSIAVI